MSPELHKGYSIWHKRQGGKRIVHCPYKSDVYSLGLVLLYMATFVTIDERFCNMDTLADWINEVLSKVNSLTVRRILRCMLDLIPDQRPDFIQLHEIFERISNEKICSICEEVCETNSSTECKNCKFQYHKQCTLKNQCLHCNGTLSINCSKCGRSFFDKKLCNHYLCDGCSIQNIDCIECLRFKILPIIPDEESKTLQEYKCFKCSNLAILSDDNQSYHCINCDYKYCAHCKDKFHPEIKCLTKIKEYNILCSCGVICSQNKMETFFNCHICGYRCVVCMENILKRHFACIKFLY